MKVGILSDIHANHAAVSVVAEELVKNQIKTLIIAGDTVGYYYEILKVRELLQSFTVFETLGNHEMMLLSHDSAQWKLYGEKYGSGLSRNLKDLGSAGVKYIRSLSHPHSIDIENTKILISHGAPWDINQYLYMDSPSELWERFKSYSEDIFVIGHTHHQMIKKMKGKIIINPGSVGQSRYGTANADWAILDLSDKSVIFKSTPYSSTTVLEQCATFDPGQAILTRHIENDIK
jgi:putative phosphoesterase